MVISAHVMMRMMNTKNRKPNTSGGKRSQKHSIKQKKTKKNIKQQCKSASILCDEPQKVKPAFLCSLTVELVEPHRRHDEENLDEDRREGKDPSQEDAEM